LREQSPAVWYRGELVKECRQFIRRFEAVRARRWRSSTIFSGSNLTSTRRLADHRKQHRALLLAMPKTQEELVSISRAMKVWEDYTHGMMAVCPTTSVGQ
jgi:hypothetical protein